MRMLFILLLAILHRAPAMGFEMIERPEPGLYEVGAMDGSFLEVKATQDGSIVTLFLRPDGPNPPRYLTSWTATGWTSLTINSKVLVGDRVVQESFNPFGHIGGIGLSDTILPPVSHGWHGFSLEANHVFHYCPDESGEPAFVCTGSYTIDYSVTPFPTPLEGDFNYDDVVDFPDFLILASNFGSRRPGLSWQDGDADFDRRITLNDFLILAANYGAVREAQTATVPAPTTVSLLVAALCSMGALRRRRIANS